MGDLFKKNYKRLTGVRGEDPVNDLHNVRLKDVVAITGTPASGEYLIWDGTGWATASGVGGGGGGGGAGAGEIASSELVVIAGTSGNVTDDHTFVLVTSTSAVAVTLLGSFTTTKIVYIKDAANGADRVTNPITITPSAGTIDFAANVQIQNTNESVALAHVSGSWYIF